MNKKVRKGLDIGAIVLVVIIFLLGAAILSLSLTKKSDGVPRIFGVTFLDIQTDSMLGTIDPGDIAVISKVKKETDLKEGDVITFWDFIDINGDGDLEKVLNTHRIIKVNNGSSATAPLMFITQGDNIGSPDEKQQTFSGIVGRYNFRVPNLGYFIRFLQSIWGFLLVVVLPLAAFLGYRIYVLVKVILDIKKEKLVNEGNDPDTLKAELEALRAKVASLEGSDSEPIKNPPPKVEKQ